MKESKFTEILAKDNETNHNLKKYLFSKTDKTKVKLKLPVEIGSAEFKITNPSLIYRNVFKNMLYIEVNPKDLPTRLLTISNDSVDDEILIQINVLI